MHNTDTRAKYKVDEDGKVSLVDGWIPTEKSMLTFLERLLKDRPELKRFNLTITVRTAPNDKLFGFGYNSNVTSKLDRSIASVTSRSADGGACPPPAVETTAQSEPESKITVNPSVIRALYDKMLGYEELFASRFDGDSGNNQRYNDDDDQFEMDMYFKEEAADMEYGPVYDEDEFNDAFQPLQHRPRF